MISPTHSDVHSHKVALISSLAGAVGIYILITTSPPPTPATGLCPAHHAQRLHPATAQRDHPGTAVPFDCQRVAGGAPTWHIPVAAVCSDGRD